MRRLLAFTLLLAAVPALSQTEAPSLDSHQVNADGSITFRYQNAAATKVAVVTDAAMDPLDMQRDSAGLWSVTTRPLPAERYSYSLFVDGVSQLDPLNDHAVPNLLFLASSVLVPGHPPAPWELTQIPHGTVTRHLLTTYIAKNLPMNQEPYVVYTPPGYDAKRKGGYPILYLLHGWSDSARGWTDVGDANLILDSLIATNRAVPMIVVMPMGYGNYDFITSGFKIWKDTAKVEENIILDSRMLTQEIMPAVDREYNVARGRDNHAIAGLSMGGLESLSIGINHAAQFAWVGGFSAAVEGSNFGHIMPDAGQARDLRLLWVACGTSDSLLKPNRDFVAWAKSKKLPVTPIETSGKHTWLVWRDNLLQFAPLLFKK